MVLGAVGYDERQRSLLDHFSTPAKAPRFAGECEDIRPQGENEREVLGLRSAV